MEIMEMYHELRKHLGRHIHCHTQYGMFEGVVVHCSKNHIILDRVPTREEEMQSISDSYELDLHRPYPMGPMGPGGPLGPGPGGPNFGGGWHMAIPLAAIVGITAVGMHWW
jgi:hypothetical protein